MSEKEFHPAAGIFPLIGDHDIESLAADIGTYGLRVPIVLCDDKILDGRNRYLACKEAGIDPRYEQFNGTDPIAYVLSLNLKRRHLDESQRAMVAAKAVAMRKLERLENPANLRVLTQPEVARQMNVSERSVSAAKKVLDHGAPELVDAVERGEVAVSSAAEKCRSERSPRSLARETMERAIEQAVKFFSDTDLSEMTESQRASHEHSADIFTAAVASQRYADTRFGDLFFLAAMKILSDVPDLAGMVERLIKAGKLDAPVVTRIGRALTAAGSPIIQGESHAMATVARTCAAARRGASG